jgi:group I intron endonuclease
MEKASSLLVAKTQEETSTTTKDINLPGIYAIHHLGSGRFYIGSAHKSIAKRWREHKHYLRRKRHHSTLLQRAWDKYGENEFEFLVLETVSHHEIEQDPRIIITLEQIYLDLTLCYESGRGFNICKEAYSRYGMKASEETRAKLSAIMKGRKHSLETRQRMSLSRVGRKVSVKTREKLRILNLGKTITSEQRRNISQKLTGRKLTKEHRQNQINAQSRRFKVYSPDGVEQTVKNLEEFCRQQGLNPAHLRQVASGNRKQHKGWRCERLDEIFKRQPPSDEVRAKISEANAWREYIAISPEGKVCEVENLTKFCQEKGLNRAHMAEIARNNASQIYGKGKRKSHKGWKCKHKDNHDS